MYGEKNGCLEKENGLDKPEIWGKIYMFIISYTHQRLFWLLSTVLVSLSRKLFFCVCTSAYAFLGFNFEVNSYCDSLFSQTTSNFSLLSVKD